MVWDSQGAVAVEDAHVSVWAGTAHIGLLGAAVATEPEVLPSE
jgi:hypothetical protein